MLQIMPPTDITLPSKINQRWITLTALIFFGRGKPYRANKDNAPASWQLYTDIRLFSQDNKIRKARAGKIQHCHNGYAGDESAERNGNVKK